MKDTRGKVGKPRQLYRMPKPVLHLTLARQGLAEKIFLHPTEQQLFDRIPALLAAISREGRAGLSLSAFGREVAIELTRWSLDRADRNEGRRNLWLRTLDRLGLGFDS